MIVENDRARTISNVLDDNEPFYGHDRLLRLFCPGSPVWHCCKLFSSPQRETKNGRENREGGGRGEEDEAKEKETVRARENRIKRHG